jgi:hypothetical protein
MAVKTTTLCGNYITKHRIKQTSYCKYNVKNDILSKTPLPNKKLTFMSVFLILWLIWATC